MPFSIFYQEVHRKTRDVEVSTPNQHYDSWELTTFYEEDEMKMIHSSIDLYNLLNRWFRYIEGGHEGEERAEGHGWYFKIYVRIDGLYIDITESMLNYFEELKNKIIEGKIQ